MDILFENLSERNFLALFAVGAAARDSVRQCLTNPSREAFATDETQQASLRLSRLCLRSTSKVDVSMARAIVASSSCTSCERRCRMASVCEPLERPAAPHASSLNGSQ
jgi:hypothetical protein